MDFLEIFSRKFPVYNFTDILPMGDALMNANRRTEMKQNDFISTVITHKNACNSRGNLQDRTVVHEILEVSTQHYILSPAIRRLYKYLYLPMACNFPSSDAIVYISSKYCNYLRRRHHRAALNSTSLSHTISFF